MAYKRKAHKSAHTCIFHTLKAADNSQQVPVLVKVQECESEGKTYPIT